MLVGDLDEIVRALMRVNKKKCFQRTLWLIAVLALAADAQAVVLYDGSLNTLPAAQGWRYVSNPFSGSSATQAASGGAVTLDTTAVGTEQAGYFSQFPVLGSHPAMPTLDRTAGFTIRFDARIVSESHQSLNRAGFSVIALASDSQGLELGFWPGEVWAQTDSPLFTHGEGAAWNTAAMHRYELAMRGSQYALYADGSRILQGSLRNYSSFGFPYNLSSFLFFGDDTSSASASMQVASIEVLAYAVPEPGTLTLAAAAIFVLPLFARRQR